MPTKSTNLKGKLVRHRGTGNVGIVLKQSVNQFYYHILSKGKTAEWFDYHFDRIR